MRIWKYAPLLIALTLGAAAPALAEDAGAGHKDRFERMCANKDGDQKASERAQRHADKLAEKLKLTDAQKATFKDFQDARTQTRADDKAALCANKPDLSTFEKRLAFRQARAEKRLADMKAITPKLLAFYNSLDDKQKAAFDEPRKHGDEDEGHHGDDK